MILRGSNMSPAVEQAASVSLRSGTLARFARMAGLIAKRRENGVSPRPRFERVRKIANGVHRTRRPNPKQL
jgi:hypothetical protein